MRQRRLGVEFHHFTDRDAAQKRPHHDTFAPVPRQGMHAEHRVGRGMFRLNQGGEFGFRNNHAINKVVRIDRA